jgi:hypothetical protein
MDTFQVVVILIGLANVSLLAVLVWRLQELERRFCKRALRSLEGLEKRSMGMPWTPPLSHHHRGGSRAAAEYFVYWQWTNGTWRFRPEMLPAGADAGSPPGYPGTYHGQVVKTWMGRKE